MVPGSSAGLSAVLLGSALGLAAMFAPSRARAAPTSPGLGRETVPVELVASFSIVAPASSPYRLAANAMGYDQHGARLTYQGEVGGLLGVAWGGRFSIGPMLRADFGRLGAPYDGLDPITTDAGFVALREELAFFDFPRFFAWLDESIGVAMFGVSGDRRIVGAWGLRGGIGVRLGATPWAPRLRFGYGSVPTLARVTDPAGGYDFGGFSFSLEGAFRVLE